MVNIDSLEILYSWADQAIFGCDLAKVSPILEGFSVISYAILISNYWFSSNVL